MPRQSPYLEGMPTPPSSSEDPVPRSLSVVVPTYRRQDQVLGLVGALLSQPELDEVVVAIDGPDEDLVQRLEALQEPRVVLVALPHNVGQSAAREAGARAATGELVLLVDDDVELERGAVAGHARAHADRPGQVLVGYNPVALPARRRPGMAATYLYAAEYEAAWQDLLRDEDLVLYRLWAGHMSLERTSYLRAAGHVWPVRYHEDQDLGRRLKAEGLRGRAAPQLGSRHHHSRTFRQSVDESRRQGEALALLARRWPDRPLPDYATRAGRLGVLDLLSRPAVGRLLVGACSVLGTFAGRLHLWGVETAALRLARQSTLRGALRTAQAQP